MTDEEARRAREVENRAALAGLPIRPEDLQSVAQGWALIEPHLARVTAADLPPQAEPAPFFKP